MTNKEIKEQNIKSNSADDDGKDNFFVRNIHLLLAMLWGLCALSIYFFNY